jgi:hypothetical protein
MYDPGLGAFISVDPVMVLTDPQQWNAYAYSNNNPMTNSDPTGLSYSGYQLDPASGGGCGCDNGYDGGGGESSGGGTGDAGSDETVNTPVNTLVSGLSGTFQDMDSGDGKTPEHTVGYTVMVGMYSPQTEETLGWLSWLSSFADASQLGLYLACLQSSCPVYEDAGGSAALTAAGILVPGPNVVKGADEVAGAANNRPPDLTPPGAGRSGAFNQAKRDSGVPTSMSPTRVLPNLDRRGNLQPGRQYEFDVPAPGGGTRTVNIREDSGGHVFLDNPVQNRGPHFNTEDGGHYDY